VAFEYISEKDGKIETFGETHGECRDLADFLKMVCK